MDAAVKKLSNGVKCCVFPKKGYLEKEVMIAFGYGSADTRFNCHGKQYLHPNGTAHFIEHKMFEDEQMDIYGEFSRLGASANAFTNFDTTAYYFSCTENFDDNLSLLFGMINDFHVTDESVEREKSIITQEINMYKDDPDWQSYFGLLNAMYSKNTVRNDIAGSAESVGTINADILRQGYDIFYTCDNAVIIAAGDINPDDFCERAEMGIHLPQKCIAERLYADDGINTKTVNKKADTAIPVFNMGFRLNIQNNALNICNANVLLEILAGKSSAFYDRAYNEGIIDTAPGTNCLWGKNVSACIINGRAKYPEKLREYLTEELNHYRAYGVSEDYTDKISKKMRYQMERNFNSIASICSMEADCFTKNTEVLDIYENYGKIDYSSIADVLSSVNTDEIILSSCN